MSWHNSHSSHRPQITLCLVALLGLLVFSSVLRAQEPDPIDVIRVRTDLVTVPLTVTGAQGRRISDLTAGDFLLTDDDRSAKIEYFASGAQKVALAFVLDNSGSLRDQLSRQRDAALALFSRFGPGSSVAVVRFGQQASLVAPFTDDIESARVGFVAPAALSQRAAIFDAALSVTAAFQSRTARATERRIAILISDGLDTASHSTARQAIESANRAVVSFYVIQLPLFMPSDGRLVPRPAAKGFRDLAVKTGGKYFVAGDAKFALTPNYTFDLSPVFTAIEEDLRSQYVVGFYPREAARDGRPHRVAVVLAKPARKSKVNQLKTTYSLKSEP